MSSPLSTTLISGTSTAVLVGPPFTIDQTSAVGDWIGESGRKLMAIYITHGHGDHWFGASLLQRRFESVEIYATAETAAHIDSQQAPAVRKPFWDDRFPGQIPANGARPSRVPGAGLELEGHALLAVRVGHSDTDDSTVLHVPSIGLVVAGDVVYNGVHQYMVAAGNGGTRAWLSALDGVEDLQPAAVVAGHKNRDLNDDPAAIELTRGYLLRSLRLLEDRPTREAYFDRMMAAYPHHLNPKVLWRSATALITDDSPTEDRDNS